MNKVEHNEKNIARLVDEAIKSSNWDGYSADMDAVIQDFCEDRYDYYTNDKEAFDRDWADMDLEPIEGDEDESNIN